MNLPPRPLLDIHGFYRVASKDPSKKYEGYVTDFYLALDLAETMLTGWERNSSSKFRHFEVVWDGDDVLAYRGGLWKSRTYKPSMISWIFGSSDGSDAEILESGTELETGPIAEQEDRFVHDANLRMWCERFCADPSPLKSWDFL